MLRELKKSFLLLSENKKKWLICSLFDFLFLVLLIISASFFYNLFMRDYDYIGNTLENILVQDGQISGDLFSRLSGVSDTLINMLFIVLEFFLVAFLLWSLFQSVSWLISRNIVKRSKKFDLDYLLDFALFSLIWTLILGLIIYIFYNNSSLLQTFSIFILNIPLLLFVYFGVISFALFSLSNKSLKSFKECFLLGIKNPQLLFPFLIFLLILFFIGSLLSLVGLKLVNGFVFLLFLTWFRVYLLILVEKYVGDML